MALSSMTGYGRAKVEENGLTIEVEAKSVNNRFLDVVWRLPTGYSSFEPKLKKAIGKKMRRGRLELAVNRKDSRDQNFEISFQKGLLKSYIEVARDALGVAGIKDEDAIVAAAVNFLQRREVVEISLEEAAADQEYPLVEAAIIAAVDDLVKMREVEGKALEAENASNLQGLEGLVKTISEKADKLPSLFQDRLTARLGRLSPEGIDEARLAQEVAVIADRVDITEELARLDSHITQFHTITKNAGGGRKLEFLLQEMGREVNTIGSKAQNSDIAADVIEAKSVLEKLREQVLNIE